MVKNQRKSDCSVDKHFFDMSWTIYNDFSFFSFPEHGKLQPLFHGENDDSLSLHLES
jgi:hypothetical protein